MRLYLASVLPDEIEWAHTLGWCDGIVATPGVLAATVPHADPREILSEVAAVWSLPIFTSVGSLQADQIVREGKALARLAEQIIVAADLTIVTSSSETDSWSMSANCFGIHSSVKY